MTNFFYRNVLLKHVNSQWLALDYFKYFYSKKNLSFPEISEIGGVGNGRGRTGYCFMEFFGPK